MMEAIEFLLKLIDWQFFGTLTFRNDEWSRKKKGNRVDEFIREWAAREQVPMNALPTIIRWEFGEMGGREHCHFLITGFPDRKVSRNSCFRQMRLWWKKAGLAKIRIFDPTLPWDIGPYVCKPDPRNEYETRKFDRAPSVVINAGAWDKLQMIRGVQFEVAPST